MCLNLCSHAHVSLGIFLTSLVIAYNFLSATFYVPVSLCSGPSQECCYDSAGNLHTNSPGGGSVNRFGSATMDSQSDHHLFDLFPYVHCCKGELRSCSNYYEVRPSDLGRNFFPPLPGAYLWHIASSCIIPVSCLNLYACTCVHTYNMP